MFIICVPLLGQEVGDRFPCSGKAHAHAWVSAEECDFLHVSKHVKIMYTLFAIFKLTCDIKFNVLVVAHPFPVPAVHDYCYYFK